MNIVRTVCLFRNQNATRTLVRQFRVSASKFESTQASQPQVQEEKYSFEDLRVLERTERRKARIPPFMKNVFVSEFNKDLLAYPEILNKEEMEALEQRAAALERVFSDPEKTEEERKDALKRTRMYAAPVSLTHGGLAMNVTESLRYLEVISSDLTLAQRLSDHWVALEVLNIGLTSDQYQQIIGDVTSGEHTIALCIKERVAERISQADFRTVAELDSKGVWRITGEKSCQHADGYLLVLCLVDAERYQAFLVHPGAEGVSCDGDFVSFMKTPGVPLIEAPGAAQKLALSRLHTATLCRSRLALAVRAVGEYVNSRVATGKRLSELPSVRAVFGDAVLSLYAAESAEYLTAGLADGYLAPDVELEHALTRNFMATRLLSNVLDLVSVPAMERPSFCAQLIDEARHLVYREESAHSVSMFIALSGIQHAGAVLAEEVKAVRNPLFHPTFIMKKVFANRHQEKDDPKLTLYLAEHLHPSLRLGAEQLEYCVLRMRFACETLLARHGNAVVAAHTELHRLSEAATNIYAMTAVLARASRAYCIGLRNAETEMKLAQTFVEKTKLKVKKLILEIDDGEFLNLDHFKIEFGKKLLDSKTNIVEKPIARVFW